MKRKQKNKKNSAYTFIEMIMTMTILAFIAGIASPMMTASKHRTELVGQALLIENLIKTAQNMSVTGEQSDAVGGIPTYGFGINFSSSSDVFIFANIFDEEDYQYEAGSDVSIIERNVDTAISIEDNIKIDRFEDSQGTKIPSSYGANIVFLPPNGDIILTDNTGVGSNSFDFEMNIFLKHDDSVMCYKFTINKVTGRFFKTKVDCTI